MIQDKSKISAPAPDPSSNPISYERVTMTQEEAYTKNALTEAYKAVRKILETLTKDPDDPNSGPLFRTIKLDTGQLARIKNNTHNLQYALAFPAVFIHFVDVYYNIGQSRIGEGKGTMRIHYILNTLNNEDDDVEAQGFEVYQRINAAINEHKREFPALVNRFQLAYWDMPLTFDDGLQPFWIDYQIWFNDYSGYRYKNYVDTYIVEPPFTNHSDQEPEHTHGHSDHKTPTYDEVSQFTPLKKEEEMLLDNFGERIYDNNGEIIKTIE